jgi:hypothetical protein
MGPPSFAKGVLATLLSVVALLQAPAAFSAEIRIYGGACAKALHLVVRDAALSDVLKRLAEALHFQLFDVSRSNASVSVAVIRNPVELVANLAPSENISMALAWDSRCPQKERIAKVWVLPRGGASQTNASIAEAIRPRDQGGDEQARREKAGIDMVLRAHGVPPAPRQQPESR